MGAPGDLEGKHWSRGTVAVPLGAIPVSSIRLLCFYFLSWNKSGMETLGQTHNRESGRGRGPAAGNSQITLRVVFAFSFLRSQVFKAKASLAT